MVELLVAIILFAVIMLFGMVFFSFSTKSFSNAQETTFAISCANSELERLKTVDWVDVTTGERIVTEPQTGINYTVTWTVTDVPNVNPDYRGITVAVTWQQQKAPVTLTSIRSRP